MTAKATKAKAKAVAAAPAGDKVDGAAAQSTEAQATAGIAPAAGAAGTETKGPGDGLASSEQAFTALAPVPHQMVLTRSLVAQMLTPPGSNAGADGDDKAPGTGDSLTVGDDQNSAGDGDPLSLETAQTPAENGLSSPVILGSWSLPAIDEFPATLTLTNHTASRIVVLGQGIPVDGSLELEVTEQQFSKLAKSWRGSARLDKWDNVRGLQVAHESTD